jgi:hypothetical protein
METPFKLVKPHAKHMVKDMLKILDRKFETYKTDLDNKFFKKEGKMISELDNYHNKASEILNKVLEDFYAHTVPYTVPPNLRDYINEHLKEHINEMVMSKMNVLLDKQTTTSLQQQVDQLV